ncbi:MAG: hypothetical protein H2061_06210 [Burkholderiales bacterium]|nr:hypothetical protein [Burkholderiales bacterium]OUT77716.1 MAG: hypothetical protein CBB82_06085 [Betaproteobacteria bacterium TMED22]
MTLRFCLSIVLMIAINSALAGEEVRVLSSEGRLSSDLGGTQAARMDFNFGTTRAWLLDDGQWKIEGDVIHRSGFCGTYQLGIQFGTGSPGCANVRWLSAPIFATKRLQCNGAGAFHSGSNYSFSAKQSFDEINCAQRVIKCKGKCN